MSTEPPFPHDQTTPPEGEQPQAPTEQPANPPAYPPQYPPPPYQQYPPPPYQQYSQPLPPYGYAPMQQPTQGMGTGAKIAIGGSIGCIGLVMVFVIAFIFIVIAGVVLLSIIGHQVNNVFSNIQTSVPQQPFPT